jgi:UBX domain-containing protein 1/4
LADLKAKMLVRKREQAEKERQEAKANEVFPLNCRANKLIRRKRDQDSAALIEEAKYKERLRQIEKDKAWKREEMLQKQKIKAQIEADKQARKEKVIPA